MLNIFIIFITSILSLFIGFTIGRAGDKYIGPINNVWIIPVPHHWIWSFPFATLSFFVFVNNLILSIFFFFFGLGLLISDLDDFLKFRVIEKETSHEWKFWGTD